MNSAISPYKRPRQLPVVLSQVEGGAAAGLSGRHALMAGLFTVPACA